MTTSTADTVPSPRFITTAIPYVNARPHVGFAFEAVLTDALARYHRARGDDVYFATGSDENSLKNVQAAEREGLATAALVARNAADFYALRGALDLSFDDFVRTSVDPRHLACVRKLWEACARRGDIYKRVYRGLYCVGCEQFFAASDLVDGRCDEHGTVPEVVEEENYFFRLSRYRDALRGLLASGDLRVEPETRRNEVLRLVDDGLQDFSISRSHARAHGWGLPVPGDASQVVYVWFDALGNYLSALDYAAEGPRYQRYWRDNPHRVHVVGKGITRFHAVYWPAILLSAGVLPPSTVFVHGYLTVDGRKISKSLGNTLDPVALVAQFGTDALRYYLLRHFRATDDGDFSVARLVQAHNTELADQLGNLLHRTLGLVHRYYGGVVPAPDATTEADPPLREGADALRTRVAEALERYCPQDALAALGRYVECANRYVAETAPWTLAAQRSDPRDPARAAAAEARLATTLYHLVEALRIAALHYAPFLPATAAAIATQLGLVLDPRRAWAGTTWGGYPPGTRLPPARVLFPKLELPTR